MVIIFKASSRLQLWVPWAFSGFHVSLCGLGLYGLVRMYHGTTVLWAFIADRVRTNVPRISLMPSLKAHRIARFPMGPGVTERQTSFAEMPW